MDRTKAQAISSATPQAIEAMLTDMPDAELMEFSRCLLHCRLIIHPDSLLTAMLAAQAETTKRALSPKD